MNIHSLTFAGFGQADSSFCQALINQNVYIGENPIGHACHRKATKKIQVDGIQFAICDQCNDWIIRKLVGDSGSFSASFRKL